MVHIHGKQITLRDFKTDDLTRFKHWMQPGHRWQDFDGPYYRHPTPDEIVVTVEHLRSRIENHDWLEPRDRLVIAACADDRLLGMVTRYWISRETNWPALGIVIYDPAQWGQGIGYEAFGLWSDYLLHAFPEFVRLDLRTWSGNAGMMHLAQKLGYKEEARFRMARIVKGQYYDGLAYGVLRSEWAARYPQGFAAHLGVT